MQIHFGVMRNPCTPMFERLGPDSGFDIIGGRSSVTELARMLDLFAIENALPRTVIYSVNPADNAAIGTLIGGFQLTDGSGMPRVMQGSAWWFNDNKTGMREQMTSLANLSAFGSFLGMLTAAAFSRIPDTSISVVSSARLSVIGSRTASIRTIPMSLHSSLWISAITIPRTFSRSDISAG